VELCRREGLITEENCAELRAELEVLAKMITALIKGVDRRREDGGAVESKND
jgi:hypothetical protein